MCENDSSCPSQPFLHNLSLMNLDIIILEYGHDVSYGCLRNEKLHTPSVKVRKTSQTYNTIISIV